MLKPRPAISAGAVVAALTTFVPAVSANAGLYLANHNETLLLDA
jgi:hypothetical protein